MNRKHRPRSSHHPRAPAIDIGARVRSCVEQIRPEAEAKGLTLRCEVDADLPLRAECEPIRLRQVLFNLLSNAVKFTQCGWVSVCAERAWDDPDMVAISVTDTGIGMTEAQFRAAHDRAGEEREEEEEEEEEEGRPAQALGLAISGALARLIGGSLSLTSQPGGGTRVELRLPLAGLEPPTWVALEIIDKPAISGTLVRRLGRTGSVRTERRQHRRTFG